MEFSRENLWNFLEKMCGGAKDGEESCLNFWVSESLGRSCRV